MSPCCSSQSGERNKCKGVWILDSDLIKVRLLTGNIWFRFGVAPVAEVRSASPHPVLTLSDRDQHLEENVIKEIM